METKTVNKSKLIKRFNTLLSNAGIKEEGKRGILAQYGATSTLDLDEQTIEEICNRLGGVISSDQAELNKMRKQLMASIYQYLKAFGTPTNNPEYVKAIACQGGGFDDFNAIPKERLRSLIHSFNNQTKDLNNVAQMTSDRVDYLTTLN